MTADADDGRVFYGWFIVGGAWILNMLNQAGFTWGFTVFVKPLGEEFGWSRGAITLAWACSLGWALVLGPWTGKAFDRYGPRPLILFGGLAAGSGWLLITAMEQYWSFFVVFVFFVGTGLNATMGIAGGSTITQWFRRRRSTALGVYHTSSGGAGLLLIPFLGLLVSNYGWRVGATVLGVLILSLATIVTPIMRHRPEQYGMQVDGPLRALAPRPSIFATFTVWLKGLKLPRHRGSTDQDYTLKEAFRTLAFWLFVIAIWFRYLGMGMSQVHLFPHMEQQGFGPVTAASVLSLSLIVNIPSRLILGWLGDTYDKKWLLNICAISGGVALLALTIATSATGLLVWAYPVFWGIGLSMLPLQGAWLGDMYGRKHYGSISTTSSSLTLTARIVGALGAAWAFDVLGSYEGVFLVGGLGFFLGAALLTFLPHPEISKTTDALAA